MAETEIDLATWPRAAQFDLFRTFERPQYAVTARVDIRHLLARKADGISPYHGCLFAISTAMHRVEAMRLRFRGDRLFLHDRVDCSATVPLARGGFGYVYLPHHDDFASYDATAKTRIAESRQGKGPPPNIGQRDDVAYLSCLPWIDFTAITNAIPGPQDCIPRIAWGKFADTTMAMGIELHHALADGADVGAFFDAVQTALDEI